MVNPEIRAKIEKAAKDACLDADLVEAFVMTESSGNPKATRYEPAFYKRYVQPLLGKAKGLTPHELAGRATSWGLMQLMGQVARELGFKGQFEELFIPEIGLKWSLKHLCHFIDKYHDDLDMAIAAYNAGTPKRTDTGKSFRNQAYVDKVRGYLKQIKAS